MAVQSQEWAWVGVFQSKIALVLMHGGTSAAVLACLTLVTVNDLCNSGTHLFSSIPCVHDSIDLVNPRHRDCGSGLDHHYHLMARSGHLFDELICSQGEIQGRPVVAFRFPVLFETDDQDSVCTADSISCSGPRARNDPSFMPTISRGAEVAPGSLGAARLSCTKCKRYS